VDPSIANELKCRLWLVLRFSVRISILNGWYCLSFPIRDRNTGQNRLGDPDLGAKSLLAALILWKKATCIRPNRASFWALKLIHGHARIIAWMTRFFMATWRLWAKLCPGFWDANAWLRGPPEWVHVTYTPRCSLYRKLAAVTANFNFQRHNWPSNYS